MSEKLRVKCRRCGYANDLKMGRIYTIFRCEQCDTEIDLDATFTFELVPEQKPVKLIRDTVTVGFRPRRDEDRFLCPECGARVDAEVEDVIGEQRTYKCSRCGRVFTGDEQLPSPVREKTPE
jgi:DNA-directed RNA polymerase subunit RPC12/RpoP